ncbi:hypothetical protein K1719_008675 [Acacia pycnantha]|nr:hypothetical protein K1719_008675 [Acacia pycnantha]
MQLANVKFPLTMPMSQVAPPQPSLHGSPAKEEGEVPEPKIDPDRSRRLLILRHGQDTVEHTSIEPPFPLRPLIPVSALCMLPCGGWFRVEDEMGPQQLNGIESSISFDGIHHESLRLSNEVYTSDVRSRLNHTLSFSSHLPACGILNLNLDVLLCMLFLSLYYNPVEFRPSLVSDKELQFSYEAWYDSVGFL